MLTSFRAPYDPTFTPACATLGTVLFVSVTAFAQTAVRADFHITRAALIAMIGIIIQVQFAKSMFTATRHGRIFTSYFEGVVTFLAVIPMTVSAMFFNQRIFTVTLIDIFIVCLTAIFTEEWKEQIWVATGTIVTYDYVHVIIDRAEVVALI